jgi:hypothetical protein
VELLLSAVSGGDPQPADHRVSLPLTVTRSRQVADRLGRVDGSSQPRHLGVHPRAARALVGGVSSRLCAGTESGRVSVVTLEATRVAQLLPAELRAVEPTCSPSPPPDAQTAELGDRLLATGGTVFFVTILCNVQ